MKPLKLLRNLLSFVALGLAGAPLALAQSHSSGAHFGGGSHFGGAGHFGYGGGHLPGGEAHFRSGARIDGGGGLSGRSAGLPRSGYRGGITDGSGLHFTPRGSYRGYRGDNGRRWHGGYWRGRYWPGTGFRSGFVWFLPAIPLGFATYWWGGLPYYYDGDVYYTWNPRYHGYVVTDPPPAAEPDGESAADQTPPGAVAEELFAYPRNGQNPEQAAKDREECRSWAVGETGFDATHVPASGKGSAQDLQRATAACLEARGYSTR